jgi:hypothetical protein
MNGGKRHKPRNPNYSVNSRERLNKKEWRVGYLQSIWEQPFYFCKINRNF